MCELSVIILSYNTKKITLDCLISLYKSLKLSKISSEIIVVDNNSIDGSVKVLTNFKKSKAEDNIQIKLIFNKQNLGYPKGNNQGIKIAFGKNILLLNSDVLIKELDWEKLLKYFDTNKNVGVMTVKVLLTDGKIDPASHRGFPTVWNSFCFFFKLEKIFGKIIWLNRLFGGYHMTYLNRKSIHQIDSPSGAFYLTRKKILDEAKGFDDKTFFLYGEDLDLSLRIKKLGYKILYYPKFSVLHLKSVSGFKKSNLKVKNETRNHFYDAMKKFYKKHYQDKYPKFINSLVYYFIDLKKRTS
ncbi:MAG: glycosyltransferase [bacterium]